MLRFVNVSVRRGPRELIRGMNSVIHRAEKVGLVGANGIGKSSLLSLILGEITPDTGEFTMPVDTVLAHVAQETPGVHTPALEYVVEGDRELHKIEQALAVSGDNNDGIRIAQLHQRLEEIDGYAARSRAGQLLHGLGFSKAQMDQPVKTFSGGWRMRLNLAQALMCRSDLLLLDEPTNHLDLDAVIWVEEWLRAYNGTLLVISHDRDFLDRVANRIAHIENAQLMLYPGNYSDFEKIRAERLANQQAAYGKQQREITHARQFVDRFRAKASKARQAQSRLKMLERMELINPAHVDSPFNFRFREPKALPNPLVRLDKLDAGYADLRVLSRINFSVQPGDRIGLLGRNGAGKSTFVRSLAGGLAALSGQRTPARELNVGYFAQHQLEQLVAEASPMQLLRKLDPKIDDRTARSFLGGFAFQGDRALAPVESFSGGEKARLVLALIAWQRPNLLLLDEPTNHLDLEMRHALTRALQDYAGAMIVVSHDRHLLESVADQLYVVRDGRVEEFHGDLDDYRRWLLSDGKAARSAEPATSVSTANSREAKKHRRQQQAESRQQFSALRKAVKNAEASMKTLADEKAQLEVVLADSELYDENKWSQLKPLLAKKLTLEEQLAQTENRWLEATEALEAASEPQNKSVPS